MLKKRNSNSSGIALDMMVSDIPHEYDQAQMYLDITGVMIAALNTRGEITMINKKGCDILGYREGEITGRNWFDLCLTNDVRPRVKQVFDRLITGEMQFSEYYENPIITREGKERFVAFHNTLLRDSSSIITGILFSGEDITDRKLAVTALQRSEERFRKIFETGPLGMAMISADMHFMKVNAALCLMLGRSEEELVYRTFTEISRPEDISGDVENIKRLYRGEIEQYYSLKPYLHKEGKTIWVQLTVFPVRQLNEEFHYFMAFFEDVTENKKAEEALEESENKYRSLVNNIKLGIFRTDPSEKGRYLEINNAMEELTGYSRQELLQIEVSSLYANLHERTSFWAEVSGLKGKITRELIWKRKDGKKIIVACTISAVRGARGEILYYDGIVEDITERKQAEARALETETLKQLNKAKSELLANVSHELRTPLSSIKGFIETLIEPDVEWSKEAQLDFLQSANKEADHLTALIRDLLDMAQLDSGQSVMDKRSIRVDEIFDWLKNILPRITEKHILKIKMGTDLPVIKADKLKIAQVVINLVENAAKFSPEGSPIAVEVKVNDGSLFISVRDKGQGMPKEAMGYLFNRFYQVEQVVSGKTRGTGLGLSISKGIVEAHGGQIWVVSREGKGSKFTFNIPLQ